MENVITPIRFTSAMEKPKPLYELVNGKPEHHPEGVYHLCYCREDGRRAYEAVGTFQQFDLIGTLLTFVFPSSC